MRRSIEERARSPHSESRHRIGLLDSGVGGLSIGSALKMRFPNAELVYLCDNQAFPYGPKAADFLAERVSRLGSLLVNDYQLDALVVACNTASTVCLPSLRAAVAIPVVGVVPAIKPAAAMTKTGHIALWATEQTANGPYTAKLILDFAQGVQVHSFVTARLVVEAEQFMAGATIDQLYLQDLLHQSLVLNPEVDVVVLGCTHFPLLTGEFKRLAPRAVTWLDSGEAVARRLADVLPTEPIKKLKRLPSSVLMRTIQRDIAEGFRQTLQRDLGMAIVDEAFDPNGRPDLHRNAE